MFGIYRGRRLALYIALAIIIATHNNDVNLHPAAINLITNYFRSINMRAKGRR